MQSASRAIMAEHSSSKLARIRRAVSPQNLDWFGLVVYMRSLLDKAVVYALPSITKPIQLCTILLQECARALLKERAGCLHHQRCLVKMQSSCT